MSNYKNDYMEAYFKNRSHLIPHEENLKFLYFEWTRYIHLINQIPKKTGEFFTICCYYGIYQKTFIETCKRLNIKKVYSPHVEIGKN